MGIGNAIFVREKIYRIKCDKVVDPNKRKEILSKQKRCFVCLKRDIEPIPAIATEDAENATKSIISLFV